MQTKEKHSGLSAKDGQTRQPTEVADARHANAHRWITRGLIILIVLLGALQTWGGRYFMNPDGVSYLDIGDAYFRGEWGNAASTYWSPLYSLILGGVLGVVRPDLLNELPVVHVVNFAIFLITLGAFHYFLRSLISLYESRFGESAEDIRVPRAVWLLVGHSLFGFAALRFVGVDLVTPDLLLAALVFLAAGTVVKIAAGAQGWGRFLLLGLILGIGYLAKSAMLPVGMVFIFCACLLVKPRRIAVARSAAALFSLAAVAAPFIWFMAAKAGRFTLGDAGRLNQQWAVSDQWYSRDFATRMENAGESKVKGLHRQPAVLQYEPAGVTYPAWKNPAILYGIPKYTYSLSKHLRLLLRNSRALVEIVFERAALGTLVLLLCFLGGWRLLMEGAWRNGALLLPSVCGIAMYWLVLIEPRYIAAFLVVMCLTMLATVRISVKRIPEPALVLVLAAVSAQMLIATGQDVLRYAFVRPASDGDIRAARALRDMGLRPGDTVAFVGNPSPGTWARLARLQITGEVLDANEFWQAGRAERGEAISTMSRAGLAALVAAGVPKQIGSAEGWASLGESGYSMILLREAKASNSTTSRDDGLPRASERGGL